MPPPRSNAARTEPHRGAPGHRGAPSRPSRGFQPRHVSSRAPLSRIRWDRASRVAMLVVLIAVAWLWVSGLSSLLRTHAQAERGLAQVRALAAQNHQLVAEQKSLSQLSTILADARKLGMVRSGEQAFVVTH